MSVRARGLRPRLVLSAAAVGLTAAVVQALVVHAVIDSSVDEAIAERVEHYTVWASVGAGALMVLLATLLAAWASRRALAPVGAMARTAAAWSEHDLDRRFDLGAPTDELRALGHTLDGLLDKVSRVIHGEQRLTSELAHELRTPLAAIRATADLIALRPDLDDELRADVTAIVGACTTMAATVTGLLDLARAARPGGEETAPLGEVVDAAVASAGAGRVQVLVDRDLSVGISLALGARALSPVLDNAARLAEHVTVQSARHGNWVEVTVRDDGPGVAADLTGAVFEPGCSGTGGSGLGLPLARRIVRGVGGDIQLDPPKPGSGAVFIVRLPAASTAGGGTPEVATTGTPRRNGFG